MTVREWFRMQRAAMWASDLAIKHDIDVIARTISFVHSEPPIEFAFWHGDLALAVVPEEVQAREAHAALLPLMVTGMMNRLRFYSPDSIMLIRRNDQFRTMRDDALWGGPSSRITE